MVLGNYQVTFVRPVGAHLDSTGHGPTAQRKRIPQEQVVRGVRPRPVLPTSDNLD
jgi:hypothetical protein